MKELLNKYPEVMLGVLGVICSSVWVFGILFSFKENSKSAFLKSLFALLGVVGSFTSLAFFFFDYEQIVIIFAAVLLVILNVSLLFLDQKLSFKYKLGIFPVILLAVVPIFLHDSNSIEKLPWYLISSVYANGFFPILYSAQIKRFYQETQNG